MVNDKAAVTCINVISNKRNGKKYWMYSTSQKNTEQKEPSASVIFCIEYAAKCAC